MKYFLVAAAAVMMFVASNVSLPAAGDQKVTLVPLVQLRPEELHWTDGPPTMPKGTKVAVLEGDPQREGPFTFRMKIPAHTDIPPHWHPAPERVTVISGSIHVGFGDSLNKENSRLLSAGSFYINPANTHHFVWTDEEVTLQFTGTGPWIANFVHQNQDKTENTGH